MRVALRCTGLALVFTLGPSTSSAQDTQAVANCVNAAPVLDASDPKAARDQLGRLLWRSAHEDYIKLLKERGALTAFDAIAARGDSLVGMTVQLQSGQLQAPLDSLKVRLARTRGQLVQSLRPDLLALKDKAVIDATPLRMQENAEVAGVVRMGFDAQFEITPGNRAVAAAICATAATASRYLELILEPRLRQIADEYARSLQRWNLFLEGGYSMTLVERLAASCRLWLVGRVLNPIAKCEHKEGESLDPPIAQVLFVHPQVGLAPLLKADSMYNEVVVVEWWGVLRHFYGDDEMRTFGLSVATSSSPQGPGRLGGVLRTPYGSVGVFPRKSTAPLYVVSADVIGWVPGVRKASSVLRNQAFQRAAPRLAANFESEISKLASPAPR